MVCNVVIVKGLSKTYCMWCGNLCEPRETRNMVCNVVIVINNGKDYCMKCSNHEKTKGTVTVSNVIIVAYRKHKCTRMIYIYIL